MGLLNEQIQGLDYGRSELANYRPKQEPVGVGILEALGQAFIPETMSRIAQIKVDRNAPSQATYQQLAEYYAQAGNPQRAQQYAELAQAQNPKTREVFSRTEGVVNDQGETGVLLTYRNGEQEFKPVQYAPNLQPTGRATAAPRVPVGMMWDAEQGRAVQIPGVPVKAPAGRASSGASQQMMEPDVPAGLTPTPRGKTTAEQRSTLGYTDRMLQAEQALRKVANGSPTEATSLAGSIPLAGEYLKRLVQTPNQQLFDNASKEWIRAKLRKESGAAIGVDEMQQEFVTYFPQPGDGPDVIAQKAKLRQNAMASMARQAGSSLPADSGAGNQPMKSLPPASQHPGAVIRDTKFGKRFKSNGKTWEPI